MSEKLAVYRSLGDSAAVHGEIRTVFAGREGVYNLREMLFTHTGFSGDQHTQIRAGYLYGYFNVAVQQRTLPNNSKTLLDS